MLTNDRLNALKLYRMPTPILMPYLPQPSRPLQCYLGAPECNAAEGLQRPKRVSFVEVFLNQTKRYVVRILFICLLPLVVNTAKERLVQIWTEPVPCLPVQNSQPRHQFPHTLHTGFLSNNFILILSSPSPIVH